MSLTNPTDVITEQRLSEFYQQILPYLGGSAAAGFTPVGTIIPMIAETAPANYLICDGTAYNKADYPQLADHLLTLTDHSAYEVDGDSTKFKVPDLRGEFLRGTGTNSHANMGNGASVGVHQDATMIPTTWISGNGQALAWNANNPTGYPATNKDSIYIISQSAPAYKAMGTALGNLDESNTYTSRPTNTSVLYCIATKNIYLNPSLDYSTDEKVVGTWIDGRPIYQNSFPVNVSGTYTSKMNEIIADVSGLNIDIAIKYDGYVKVNNGWLCSLNMINEDSSQQLAYVQPWITEQGSLRLQIKSSSITSLVGYITIQYIKTTDA